MAAEAGCGVADNVSKKVTMLVVGTQDKSKLKGYAKSGKHRKAEALIEKGVEIQILSERRLFRTHRCRSGETSTRGATLGLEEVGR